MDELETLRARVEELERQLAEQARRANAAVAAAQERSYWLDRWHIDLNAWMEGPAGVRFRRGLRVLRRIVGAARAVKQRLAP